ncbi:MAG: hypothetical protein FJ009_21650 [Chloroflexi bacterium]|nr:hypothetical protein [Chloroflexota bacterium]
MMQKQKAALGNAAGHGFDGLGLPSLTFTTIAQSRRVVKSRYDANLSRALEYAALGIETARGRGERVFWRAVKRALESQIEVTQ